jgi:hypothetical protein
MLLARRPEKLKPDEKQLLAKLNECCPEIPILHERQCCNFAWPVLVGW